MCKKEHECVAAGCDFMLAPMTDSYEELIMGAVTQLDTSRVWIETSKLGTVFRGSIADVIDNVAACFILSYRPDVHMTAEIALKCRDNEACGKAAADGEPANRKKIGNASFKADCKFAVYASEGVKEIEEDADREAGSRGILKGKRFGSTVLAGDVKDIFGYFEWLAESCTERAEDAVIRITLSVNSPTAE